MMIALTEDHDFILRRAGRALAPIARQRHDPRTDVLRAPRRGVDLRDGGFEEAAGFVAGRCDGGGVVHARHARGDLRDDGAALFTISRSTAQRCGLQAGRPGRLRSLS